MRGVLGDARGGLRADGVEGARVRSDGKPLPSAGGNAGGEFGGGDAMGAEHLYQAVQCPAPRVGAFVPGTVQGDSGGGGERLFSGGRDLYPSQSRSGEGI